MINMSIPKNTSYIRNSTYFGTMLAKRIVPQYYQDNVSMCYHVKSYVYYYHEDYSINQFIYQSVIQYNC